MSGRSRIVACFLQGRTHDRRVAGYRTHPLGGEQALRLYQRRIWPRRRYRTWQVLNHWIGGSGGKLAYLLNQLLVLAGKLVNLFRLLAQQRFQVLEAIFDFVRTGGVRAR